MAEAEMDKKPFTFDTDGNVIWVELPKPEKLPKVIQEYPARAPALGTSDRFYGKLRIDEQVSSFIRSDIID